MEKTYGVLLTRCQPFTIAHLGLVKLILKENSGACIVIGSADKHGTQRNPFDIDIRLQLVNSALTELGKDKDRVKVFGLNDWVGEDNQSSLKQWGHYLYYNIVAHIGCKRFRLYYSDGEDILNSWFDEEVRPFITYVCNDRKELFEGISATRVRKLLLAEKYTDMYKYIPQGEHAYVYLLSSVLKAIQKE